MKNYEITFIVDPVLSGDEIKGTAQTYVDQLKEEGAKIVHVDETGLRQLAYPINKRNSGIYYTIEFEIEDGTPIDKLELALRRDERVMRFLTVRLDKYGVKYNEDKRKGLIGKVKKKAKKSDDRRDRGSRGGGGGNRSRSGGTAKRSEPTKEKEDAPVSKKAEPVEEKETAPAPKKAEPVKETAPAKATVATTAAATTTAVKEEEE